MKAQESLLLSLFFAFLVCMFFVSNVANASPFEGSCILRTTSKGTKYDLSGSVRFSYNETSQLVVVTANIRGNELFDQNTEYAMHVHQYGDLSDSAAGLSVGGHFVAENGFPDHGCPPNQRHTGDMGNWAVSNKAIRETKELDLLELFAGSSIIGRSVVLHEKTDECNGTTGNSGDRIAFCVIGIANSDSNLASNGQAQGLDPEAICVFQPTSNCKGTCSGIGYLSGSGTTRVMVHAQGLSGVHGFHMHQYGDLSAKDGSMTGNDYDPFGRDHNLPGGQRHLGDFGNIQSYDKVTEDGWYLYNFTELSSLENLLGRSLVVYSGQDNGNGADCNWEGSSGDIIMSCVIGLKNPSTQIPGLPDSVVIDNNWKSHNCKSQPQPDSSESDNAGLIAGLVVGWLFFAALLVTVVGACIYIYALRRAAKKGTSYNQYD